MKIAMCAASALIMSSCVTEPEPSTDVTTNDTYALVIGVENGYAGKCEGCLLDYKNMTTLIRPYANKLVTMEDSQATKKNVVEAMKEGVKHELFILFYSGHGGSTYASNDKTETDGKDEFMCLYDQGLLDNDIWDIVSQAKGRVVLIFDACHSGTMYRNPINFKSTIEKKRKLLGATHTLPGNVSILCWSGCPDDSYSYGSSTGGKFTNALLEYYSQSLTYDKLWKKIESDSSLKQYEKVQQTKIGANFGSRKVFQ